MASFTADSQPFESGLQPIAGWGSPAINVLLRQEFGSEPGLFLDAKGLITAINEPAAALLGGAREGLVGRELGGWASQLDHIDLDVAKQILGATKVLVARGKQTESAVSRDRVQPQSRSGRTLLAQAVLAGVICASRNIVALAGQSFTGPVAVGRLPELLVEDRCMDAVQQTAEFVIKMASIVRPKIAVNFCGWGSNWVELEITIDLEGKDPIDVFSPDVEFPNFHTKDLVCRLMFDYPTLRAVLRLPYVE